jgi:metallopeptidase MepB
MLSEKYSNPPQGPPLFNGTKESIIADNRKFCDSFRALLDKLAAEIPVEDATFESVLLPVQELCDEESGVIRFYKSASPDPDVREASAAAAKSRSEFSTECCMREDIFKLVDSAFSKDEDLDSESKKLLFEERRGYLRKGLSLPPGPQRDRIKEIWETLAKVRLDFTQNLNEEIGGIWLTLEDLRGVPQDVLDGFEQGTAENVGKFKMTFKTPDFSPVMRYAQKAETRRRALMGSYNRVSRVYIHFESRNNLAVP